MMPTMQGEIWDMEGEGQHAHTVIIPNNKGLHCTPLPPPPPGPAGGRGGAGGGGGGPRGGGGGRGKGAWEG